MAYQPIQKIPEGDESKVVQHSDDSETDIEGCSRDSEDTLFLGFRRKHIAKIPLRDLYRKTCEANVPLVVSLHLLALNLVLCVALISQLWRGSQFPTGKSKSSFAPGELQWTLAQDLIEHRVERTYIGPGFSEDWVPTPYQGWPTDENDALWKKYEAGSHIRITKEEAAHLDHPTVHYPTEEHKDEYMVGLVVFHQLHCVSNLRRALYPKRYNMSLVDEDGNVDYATWHHLDHCLDQLRTYLECHPEMTAMPFFMADNNINLVYPTTSHTCRNWDVISNWVYERSLVDINMPIRQVLDANGHVVDYTGTDFGSEYNRTWDLKKPKDWAYTIDDM